MERRSLEPRHDAPLNLLLTAGELAALLPAAVQRRDWLNAYLYAAGLNQIADDALHHDFCFLGAIGEQLRRRDGRLSPLAAHAAAAIVATEVAIRSRRRLVRSTTAWRCDVVALVDALASVVMHPGGAHPESLAGLVTRCGDVPPSLRETVLRLPACFHAFDLGLDDIEAMAARLAEHGDGDRSRPVLVVGVRTSGSYMAPLLGACLEARGLQSVAVMSLRPGRPLFPSERALVNEVARGGGVAVVVDDPPGSGQSVARSADEIVRAGIPPQDVVVCVPLFGESIPRRLRRHTVVVLEEDRWAVHAALAPAAVERALERLLPTSTRIRSVEALPDGGREWQRGHVRRIFRVVADDGAGEWEEMILVEGVGLGYFGEQAAAVAAAMPGRAAALLGIEHGLLYRAWLPDSDRVWQGGRGPSDELLNAVAEYVAERREVLSVPADASVAAVGERPVWEVASMTLSRAFGPGALPSRVAFTDALARSLLRVDQPSVVDGDTALSNWFGDARHPARMVKVDAARRSFWNLGLACFDAAFDLVGAALSAPDRDAAGRLRSRYRELTGDDVDAERWFLYELAQLWGAARTRSDGDELFRSGAARALQDYVAAVFLADLGESRDSDPLCGLDLDGVLDTETLGFPGTSPAGALALRALRAHGYRPVIVSGRSIGEVADRCRAYGLAGGAAEYGAVIHVAVSGEIRSLVPADGRMLVPRLQRALADLGVHVDPAYAHIVRAFVLDGRGRRGPLTMETVAAALAAVGAHREAVNVIDGDCQTDLVPAGVDKGNAVRELAAVLHPAGAATRALALAVGDTQADLPMLREAELACAPAHARRALREHDVRLMRRSYQRGLAEAVGTLIGHSPGTCPLCSPPVPAAGTRALLDVLSARERGRIGIARQFLVGAYRRLRGNAGR